MIVGLAPPLINQLAPTAMAPQLARLARVWLLRPSDSNWRRTWTVTGGISTTRFEALLHRWSLVQELWDTSSSLLSGLTGSPFGIGPRSSAVYELLASSREDTAQCEDDCCVPERDGVASGGRREATAAAAPSSRCPPGGNGADVRGLAGSAMGCCNWDGPIEAPPSQLA